MIDMREINKMSIRIICDSASDINQEKAKDMGITVLPLKIIFGEEEYLDGINMSHHEFYEKLESEEKLPTTSQVSPYDYERVFREAVQEGDSVICITLSSKLSGCNQSAHIAGNEYHDKVYIVDSENVCMGEQILVQLAVDLRDKGKTADEIVEVLNKEKKRIHLVALLDTLEYLKKGGRISTTEALAGTLLFIKPIAGIVDGEVKLLGKGRGRKKASSIMNKFIRGYGDIDFSKPFRLGYSGSSREYLDKYIDESHDIYDTDALEISTIGSTIGTYTGSGTVVAAFFYKPVLDK